MTDSADQQGKGGFRRRDLMGAAALGALGAASSSTAIAAEEGPSNVNAKLEAYKALFWSEFGRAANMPFDYLDCTRIAIQRGWFNNIAANLRDGKFDDESFLEKTKKCCRKAGRIAAGKAANQQADRIDGTMFNDAASIVKAQVESAAEKLGIDPSMLGGVCF